MNRGFLHSPPGSLTIGANAGQIVAPDWRDVAGVDSPLLDAALRQMQAYFEGRLTASDLPWEPGSGFHERIWAQGGVETQVWLLQHEGASLLIWPCPPAGDGPSKTVSPALAIGEKPGVPA